MIRIKSSTILTMMLIAVLSTSVWGCSLNGRKTPAGSGASETAAAEDTPDAAADGVAAVILHTNDVHCGFEDNIGYDGLTLYKKELESEYDNVFLVDSGDSIQGAPIGSISKGQEITKFMN